MGFIHDLLLKYRIHNFFFILLGIIVSGYTVYVFYWMAHLTYTGIYVLPDKDGTMKVIAVDSGSPGDLTKLHPGDLLLQIGDRKIQNLFSFWKTYRSLKPDHTYQITYKRETSFLTNELTPASPVFPYTTLIGLMYCALLLALSFLFFTVYLKKPLYLPARIAYLMCICSIPGIISFFDLRAYFNPLGPIALLFIAFVPPLSLHLCMIFPERKKLITRYPALLTLIYIPYFMGLFIISKTPHMLVSGRIDLIYSADNLAMAALGYLGLFDLYAVVGTACLIHTFFTTTHSETKKQLQWIIWGSAVSIVLVIPGLYGFVSNLDLILSGERSVPLYSYIAIFILFLAGFLSILKYRLMDIEIVIHRSISYFLVSGISILLYILVFGLLSWTFNFLVGRITFTAYVVSALIVAFLFRPLLTRIEQLVDQLFYREKVALQKTLGALSQALITVRNPKRIFQKVFQTVKDSIHIRSGVLWLLDQHPGEMKPVFSLPDEAPPASLSFDSSHPLILEFLNTQKGLTRYQIETEPRFSDQQDIYLAPFQKTDMSIFLPLIYKNTLLGVIGFSEKRSGELYSSTDVMLLTTMAHQTAVAIENARAYLQTETLNAELTKKIKEIEQQHDEIFSLQKRLLNENIYLREEIKLNFNFDEIIGSSPAMSQVLSLVEKIAPTISTVLLRGESGTGKELIARAIHFNSTCKDGPFVKVNCAAIPANLLESELFGYEKGAFTGAITSKIGKFELASSGSIFLDEIGDLEPDLQVKLLRVLQEKEFERIGGIKTLKADVRIISATNLDIEKAISSNKFREDLFYRLNVISITLPPLRDRKEDIRELTIHFLRKFSRQMGKPVQNIDAKAMETLKSYHWPGNVRELANVIERAVVLGEGENLTCNDLPQNLILSHPHTPPMKEGSLAQEIEQFEQQRIIEALKSAKGNKSEAARILGLKRTTFNNKLKKFNI